MEEDKNIAMQSRCVHCGQEQWAPAVWGISHGELTCAWCGGLSEKMTYEEYYQKLKELKDGHKDI